MNFYILNSKSKLPTAITDAVMKTMPFQRSCVPNFLVCCLAYPKITESKFYLFFQLFGVEPRTDISIIELYSKWPLGGAPNLWPMIFENLRTIPNTIPKIKNLSPSEQLLWFFTSKSQFIGFLKIRASIVDAILKMMPFQRSDVPNFLVCCSVYPIVTESNFYLFFQLFGVSHRPNEYLIQCKQTTRGRSQLVPGDFLKPQDHT